MIHSASPTASWLRSAKNEHSQRHAKLSCSLAAVVAAALLLTGCGYQRSGEFDPDVNQKYQWKSLYRTDIQTIAVPIFTTRVFQRGVETDLSAALVKQIEQRTPYKVVSRDRAETILEGSVEEVRTDTISQSGVNILPQEQQMTIRVNFTWKDIRTGRILLERKAFSQTTAYYPTLGEGRSVGTQANIEKLAIAMCQQLEAEW